MLAHEAQTTRESILVQIALLTQCIAKNVTHKVFCFFYGNPPQFKFDHVDGQSNFKTIDLVSNA